MIAHFVEFCREQVFLFYICNIRATVRTGKAAASIILQTENYTALHKIRSLQEAHHVYPAR